MKTGRPFLDRTLWPAALLLVAVFFLFERTSLDLRIQDRFYDFTTHAWWVSARSTLPRVLFYTGPKVLIIAFAFGLLMLVLGPAHWRTRWSLRRRDLGVVLAVLASGPALIAVGKATTDVYFPSQIRRYGGEMPYVRVLESYPEGDRPAKRGRGFPAGHASGGFALLSLAGLGRSRRSQLAGLAVGVVAGSAMGGYQILKGAHYLSHTIVTALVCWLLFLMWRRVFKADREQT